MSLDRFDDDPTALLTVLASAYARVSPGNADLVADMGGLGMSALGRAPPVASALQTMTSQKILIEMLLEMLEKRIMSGVIFVTHDLPVLRTAANRIARRRQDH